MTFIRINYPELGLPVGPYTHAVIHGETLYTSGLTAFGTAAQTGTICEQAIAIFEQLKLIADKQSTSLAILIKVTIFVTDFSDMAELRGVLTGLYGDHVPASSLIKIEALFASELKIEIEAVFAL
ncbi:MAG: RidA family protein [Cohaesibacteraceae bacterium]|nr:RidA family protein [Cohaesibacteraceae bacterium]